MGGSLRRGVPFGTSKQELLVELLSVDEVKGNAVLSKAGMECCVRECSGTAEKVIARHP